MSKLTDTQLIILSTAGRRDDGMVLPLPKSLKLQGGAVSHVLKSLVKKGLLDEQPAGNNAAAWRESKDGQRPSARAAAVSPNPGCSVGAPKPHRRVAPSPKHVRPASQDEGDHNNYRP
jgi:hypothetical protein